MANAHFHCTIDKIVRVSIDGQVYDYEMATESMAAKAEYLFQRNPFWPIFNNFLRRMAVNERKVQ